MLHSANAPPTMMFCSANTHRTILPQTRPMAPNWARWALALLIVASACAARAEDENGNTTKDAATEVTPAKPAKHGKAEKAEKAAQEATAEKTEKPESAEKSSGKRKLMELTGQADITATSASNPKEVGRDLREALGTSVPAHKKLTFVVHGKGGAEAAAPAEAVSGPSAQYRQARAAALGLYEPVRIPAHAAQVNWSYDGENGPQNWGHLKPEYALCGSGHRQSPINIEESETLQGPAEPIQFNYTPSRAVVTHNGHTITVDVEGDNTLRIRGSTYHLVSVDFHTPSEIQVNFKRYAMQLNLLHRNSEGQMAVLAVVLDVGNSNTLIDKVWTYLPLDASDRVRMPDGSLNINEILPADQRYYQFMGSLTSPPCTEGVLWMVIKQPLEVSLTQFKLFSQLFPMNARPLQTLNGRPVRDAQ